MLLLSDGFITIRELGSTKTNERTSTDEKSIVDNHCCHNITTKFAVGISENQKKNFLRYIGYLNFIKDYINHVLLQTPVNV